MRPLQALRSALVVSQWTRLLALWSCSFLSNPGSSKVTNDLTRSTQSEIRAGLRFNQGDTYVGSVPRADVAAVCDLVPALNMSVCFSSLHSPPSPGSW